MFFEEINAYLKPCMVFSGLWELLLSGFKNKK